MDYHGKTKEELITELQALQQQYLSLKTLYKQGLTDRHKMKADFLFANKELSAQDNEIENQLAELEIANKELLYQNKEKRKRAAELILANKEILFQTAEKELRAAANKELEAFSYSVSHDLRAPLRHINGYVVLLMNRFSDSLPHKAKHYLESIAESSQQMDRLINDLLEFSRTGRQEMRQANLDMNGILEELISSLKKENTHRDIQWDLVSLPLVYGDESMLTRVWANLLENALKFTRTRKKATISINVAMNKKEFVFSVSDNGVGFDMQFAKNLFGVFQRLHLQEEFEGTGIGLATVSSIISKHGGRIWAESTVDQGATFFFSLPKHNSLIKK